MTDISIDDMIKARQEAQPGFRKACASEKDITKDETDKCVKKGDDTKESDAEKEITEDEVTKGLPEGYDPRDPELPMNQIGVDKPRMEATGITSVYDDLGRETPQLYDATETGDTGEALMEFTSPRDKAILAKEYIKPDVDSLIAARQAERE